LGCREERLSVATFSGAHAITTIEKIRGCYKKQLLPVTPEQHQYFWDSLWQALVLVETHIYKTGK